MKTGVSPDVFAAASMNAINLTPLFLAASANICVGRSKDENRGSEVCRERLGLRGFRAKVKAQRGIWSKITLTRKRQSSMHLYGLIFSAYGMKVWLRASM